MTDGETFIDMAAHDSQRVTMIMHPVRTASIPWIVVHGLFSRAIGSMFRYIFAVISQFLIPQLIARIFRRRQRIISVDHPLDDAIPFEPRRVDVYLSFVQIWIRAMSLMRQQLGRKAIPDLIVFIDGLSQAYREARKVYRQCLSTTRRPAKAANGRFRMMYFFDPHYNCVPSLHIMIVCHTFLELQSIYARHGQAELGASIVNDLYAQAIQISDSVVFVKQHSINCISAALYMVSCLYPQFSREHACDFMGALFQDQLSRGLRTQILDHVQKLYERFMDDPRCQGPEYTDVLVDFLKAYPDTAQT